MSDLVLELFHLASLVLLGIIIALAVIALGA
jgi:hypothetical protein